MRVGDVDDVVGVHLLSFEGFFLSFLGEQFLRLYYRSILDFNQLGIVARREGRVVGFVVGIDNSFGFYRQLIRRHLVEFALAAMPAVIRKPTIIGRLMRALFKRSRQEEDGVPTATLTSLAVLPAAQRDGVGAQLVGQFLADIGGRGIRRVLLDTDSQDNQRVQRFYERQGFVIARRYVTAEGRPMTEYRWEPQAQSSESEGDL